MNKAIERKQHLVAYGFVLPFFVVFAAMLIAPLVYSGYLSFFVDRLVGGVRFVGFGNYVRAFQDPNFLAGLGRTALILLVQVPIMLGLALFFALALDSGRARGSKALRLLIFLPYAVPGVVAVLMWGYLYGQQFGLIAQITRAIGLPSPNLLSGPTILFSIMNIITWAYVGYNMVVMYSALKSIPADLYEAAEIDGASQWRLAWSVKIPLIRPAILLTVIFSVIGSFQIFNEPSLLLETRAHRDHPVVHAQLLRLQPRVREPGRQLRGGDRIPARLRHHDRLVRRAAEHPEKGAPVMTAQVTRAGRASGDRAAPQAVQPRQAPQQPTHRGDVVVCALLRRAAPLALHLLDERQPRPVLDVRAVVWPRLQPVREHRRRVHVPRRHLPALGAEYRLLRGRERGRRDPACDHGGVCVREVPVPG